MRDYFVKLQPDKKKGHRKHGKVKKHFDFIDAYLTELGSDDLEALRQDASVQYIEPDMPVFVDAVESAFNTGLDRIDQPALPLDGQYSYFYTGSGVEAYVIDSGIRYSHEDFGGRAVFGADFVDGNDNGDPLGHGTHVAGIIGGKKCGVAKNVKLISVRCIDATGSGMVSGLVQGIEYVYKRRLNGKAAKTRMVANISVGLSGISNTWNAAINAAVAAGVVVCVAAGNSNMDAGLVSPSSAKDAITVGCITNDDTKATFSNWGPTVDLYAPGVVIQSAWSSADDAYVYKSGTSMSSPFVAGVAALCLEKAPRATPLQVLGMMLAVAGQSPAGLRILNSNI